MRHPGPNEPSPESPPAWMCRAWAVAQSVDQIRRGVLRLSCRLDDGSVAPAIAFTSLCGCVAPGDRVLLNTTAVDLGLGSGGLHFVIAAPESSSSCRGSGHIVKLRYTPLQAAVPAVEEEDSPYRSRMRDADSLDAMPVACCELLSQVPGVIAGLRSAEPFPEVAVVVTDEAALPAVFSDLLADLRAAGLVRAVITTGQAFGGDLEAVTLHSGLLAARYIAAADIAIVTPGPGTAGTGTRWGFGGIRQGEALNAVHALGGRGIGVVRASSADPRPRHRGISHHTSTVFGRVATAPFAAAWPDDAGMPFVNEWQALVRETAGRMSGFPVRGAGEALDRFECTWRPWSTMGRGRADDALFYEAAAAAGLLARQIWMEGTRDGEG